MKRKINIFLLISFILISAGCSVNQSSSKGEIITAVRYNADGVEVQKVIETYNKDKQITAREIIFEQDNKNSIKTMFTYKDGILVSEDEEKRITDYSYNDKKQLVTAKVSLLGEEQEVISYSYNDKGLVVDEEHRIKGDELISRITKFYDERDNLIKIESDYIEAVKIVVIKTYDAKNFLIKAEEYEGKLLKNIIEYIYEKDLLVKEFWNLSDSKTLTTTYTYDDKNRVSESLGYSDNESKPHITIKYTYEEIK